MKISQSHKPFYGFTWIDDINTYQASASCVENGVIPLLSPSNSNRKKKWEKILNWYNLTYIKEVEINITEKTEKYFSDAVVSDAVVSVGKEYLSVATFYARTLKRPLLVVNEIKDLDTIIPSGDEYSSVVIVGLPKILSVKNYQYFSRKILCPWGILTAQDLAGLSFVIAKQFAGTHSLNRDWLLINFLGEEVQIEVTKNQNGELEAVNKINPEELQDQVCEGSWENLILMAHGEGAHIRLGSVVLCGLIGEREKIFDGKFSIKGCYYNKDLLRCKRALPTNSKSLSFKEIRAKILFLYSCNSANYATLYPSNNSAVISVSEGYAMSAVATCKMLEIEFWIPELVRELLCKNIGLGSLVKVQNILKSSWLNSGENTAPYVLFGDPSGLDISFSLLDSQGNLNLSEESDLTLARIENFQSKIIDFRSPNRDFLLVRGGEDLAAIVALSPLKGKKIQLVDRTEQLKDNQGLIEEIGRKLRRLHQLEQGFILISKQRGVKKFPEFSNDLNDTISIRLELEACLHRLVYLSEWIKRSGVWENSLETWMQRSLTQIRRWDRQMAKLASNYLGWIPYVLTQWCSKTSLHIDDHCSYCDNQLFQDRLSAPLDLNFIQYNVACSVCGQTEIWEEDGLRVELDVLSPFQQGELREVRIHISNPLKNNSLSSCGGWIIVQAGTKGNLLIDLKEEIFDNIYSFQFFVPYDLTPDLYHLRVVLVSNLSIAIVGRRWLSF